MGKVRGRFDIVCVFADDEGTYLRITSDKTRSLEPREIVACLRKYADALDAEITTQALQRADDGVV